MKFSILVPAYNVEAYLPECLKSFSEQIYKDFEVIIIDDGSTDRSGKICDTYCNAHKNAYVIHKENEGLISARREAIKRARGEYCIFCDSDDFLENNALLELSKVIDECCPDLLLYNAYTYDGVEKKPFFENVFQEGEIRDKSSIYDKLLLSYSINSICIKAVKRTILDKERNYEKFYGCNFGEDLLQSIPLVKLAKSVYYINKCLYNYRVISGMMHKYNPNYYWSYRSINMDIRRQLKSEDIIDFEEKVAFHLLIAAYGGTTQFKYNTSIDYTELDRIRDDKEFLNAYETIMKSKYKNCFSIKQRLIIMLLKKRTYKIIYLLLKYRKKNEN